MECIDLPSFGWCSCSGQCLGQYFGRATPWLRRTNISGWRVRDGTMNCVPRWWGRICPFRFVSMGAICLDRRCVWWGIARSPHPASLEVINALRALLTHSFGKPVPMRYAGLDARSCGSGRTVVLRLYSGFPPNKALSIDLHWMNDVHQLGLPTGRDFAASFPAMAQAPVDQTVDDSFIEYIDAQYERLLMQSDQTMGDPRFAPIIDATCAHPI